MSQLERLKKVEDAIALMDSKYRMDKIEKAIDGFNENDHPRDDSGKFSSGGSNREKQLQAHGAKLGKKDAEAGKEINFAKGLAAKLPAKAKEAYVKAHEEHSGDKQGES